MEYATSCLLVIVFFALLQLLLLTETTNRFIVENNGRQWNQPGWIGKDKRLYEHDRPVHQPIPYEIGPTKQCLSKDPNAYTKIWPHSGIHTHCDGIIHIHPWSAPFAWRLEGKRVVMAAFFDAIGVRYYETPLRLEFEDGTSFPNNKTHAWRMDLRVNNNITSFNNHFDELWIPYAYGNIRFVYDKINAKLKNWPQKNFGGWGAHGFNGKPYPLIHSSPYQFI